MYNPYTLLTKEILDAMLQQPMYFVRQDYPRGSDHFDKERTTSLLLTHYVQKGDDYERAARHLRLLMTDKYRFRYDSENSEHLQKLKIAASQPEGYKIYINLLPKAWKANDIFKRKINTYLLHNFPWWNYSSKDNLKVTLKERYGNLYIAMLWKGQQTEVDLNEIENILSCVTT